MDIGSLIGIILTYALVIVSMATSAGLGTYIDTPSFMIVIGGTIGIVITSMPFPNLITAVKSCSRVFFNAPISLSQLIEMLVSFSVKARRDGILALESAGEEVEDEFLKKGIRLAVDGTEPDVIREILETELEFMAERHKATLGFLEVITSMAPAMGMIGTLIGLIAMLQSMDDPAAIGPAMAVALITTLYGAMIANMTSSPMATRLAIRSGEEQIARQIMITGIMSIQAGDNPRVIEQKLNAYLPPKLRQSQFE